MALARGGAAPREAAALCELRDRKRAKDARQPSRLGSVVGRGGDRGAVAAVPDAARWHRGLAARAGRRREARQRHQHSLAHVRHLSLDATLPRARLLLVGERRAAARLGALALRRRRAPPRAPSLRAAADGAGGHAARPPRRHHTRRRGVARVRLVARRAARARHGVGRPDLGRAAPRAALALRLRQRGPLVCRAPPHDLRPVRALPVAAVGGGRRVRRRLDPALAAGDDRGHPGAPHRPPHRPARPRRGPGAARAAAAPRDRKRAAAARCPARRRVLVRRRSPHLERADTRRARPAHQARGRHAAVLDYALCGPGERHPRRAVRRAAAEHRHGDGRGVAQVAAPRAGGVCARGLLGERGRDGGGGGAGGGGLDGGDQHGLRGGGAPAAQRAAARPAAARDAAADPASQGPARGAGRVRGPDAQAKRLFAPADGGGARPPSRLRPPLLAARRLPAPSHLLAARADRGHPARAGHHPAHAQPGRRHAVGGRRRAHQARGFPDGRRHRRGARLSRAAAARRRGALAARLAQDGHPHRRERAARLWPPLGAAAGAAR
mmetsp:Transcript_11551/g.36538  ORF Transcript_11551/g.36538 Transcript_11551/m.36538 type:complete len:554 (-) Transcript_11551:97-1758(-)